MGYEYISFSKKVLETGIGHDFSFLDSDQFPADVKIRRVEYDIHPLIGLRLVIESASYTKTLEDAVNGHGLLLTQFIRTQGLSNGNVVQFMDYNPIPDSISISDGNVLYAKLHTHRTEEK